MNHHIGIIVEPGGLGIKETNFGMVTLARSCKIPLAAFVPAPLTSATMDMLASYGVQQVIEIALARQDLFQNPDVLARALADAVKHYNITRVIGLSTAWGKNLLPRVAALMEAPLVMECLWVDIKKGIARTSQYSGKTMATIQLTGDILFFGVKPNVTAPEKSPVSAVRNIFDKTDLAPGHLRVIRVDDTLAEKSIGLQEADIIIAGGRGMKNKENFSILHECAKKLSAAVAASRVAVDSGWVPYSMQVGQTGEKVSPRVYIACGISGSIQHFAGMKMAGMVISINTDDSAAIVANSDYYAVADVLDVIPEISRLLNDT